MSLKPIDIHNKEFDTRLRGYNQEQVNDFLDEIIREFENLLIKQEELEKKIKFSEEKISHFHNIQETLNKSIIVAQDAADRLKKNANKEAEMIIFEAERTADKILKEAARKATKINRETDVLQRDSRVFRQKLQLMIETQLEMVKSEEWDQLLNNQKDPEVIAPTVKEVMNERRRRFGHSQQDTGRKQMTQSVEDLGQTKAFTPIRPERAFDHDETIQINPAEVKEKVKEIQEAAKKATTSKQEVKDTVIPTVSSEPTESTMELNAKALKQRIKEKQANSQHKEAKRPTIIHASKEFSIEMPEDN
ncbi:DivIVA domain-containing protein [Atopobacter phocae]|uniref:DivIVA domain-containing protein n=1 Tax=Atopobacter phocae TaxID=136492 RepID=UPI00047110CC|nr:DivIVA domain-containing protein [Atopobacter phocae]